MFVQEKRQWGGSEREEGRGGRKEQEVGVEIMTGEGEKGKKDGKGNCLDLESDGHVVEGVRGS